jgi:hypothetical protein
MKIRTKKDCAKAAKLIGAEDITALTIAEAFGLSENEEISKRKVMRLKLETATSQKELWEVFDESSRGSEIELEALKKLLENAHTQEERWAVLSETYASSEIKFKIVHEIISHATSKDELIKIYRENPLSELSEEALCKLCEIL